MIDGGGGSGGGAGGAGGEGGNGGEEGDDGGAEGRQQDTLQPAQLVSYPAEAKAALPDQAHTSFALLRVERLLAEANMACGGGGRGGESACRG